MNLRPKKTYFFFKDKTNIHKKLCIYEEFKMAYYKVKKTKYTSPSKETFLMNFFDKNSGNFQYFYYYFSSKTKF